MSQIYLITLTKAQLDALRHAQERTELEYKLLLRDRAAGVLYWEQQPEGFPEKQRYLAMANENLAWAEAKLEQVKSVAGQLDEAKPCQGEPS